MMIKIQRVDIDDAAGYTKEVTLEEAIANLMTGFVLLGGNHIKVRPLKGGTVDASGIVPTRGVRMTVQHPDGGKRAKWEISEVPEKG